MTTAPYRFVPISPKVVEPPIPYEDLDLSKPLANGSVSGEITVTWEAKTPVAVGEQVGRDLSGKATGPVTPIQIGGRYCLPGPSLRGMIRSILEIATHSHLGRINHWRRHGVRTYDRAFMPDGRGYAANEIRAGWLTRKSNPKNPIGAWHLWPCSYRRLPIDELSRIRTNVIANRTVNLTDWDTLASHQKYVRLEQATANLQPRALLGATELIEDQITVDGRQIAIYRFPRDHVELGQAIEAVPVMTGAGEGRRYEVAFSEADDDSFPVPPEVMNVFIRMHSSYNRNVEKCVPLNHPLRPWRYWLCRKGYFDAMGFANERTGEDPQVDSNSFGIPVFYVGEPGDANFFFGLSRVIRLPWRHSVGQVAQNVYEKDASGAGPAYRVPRLPPRGDANGASPPADPLATNGWDFSRALFGWVEDDKHDGWTKPEGDNTQALAGRVAFGFAWADNAPTTPPSQLASKKGILGPPRESFYPFYLKRKDAAPGDAQTGATYDDAFAIPAGRKRYVARETVTQAPQLPLPQPNGDNADVVSTIHFLPAGTRFTGAIRFHNLDPIELGALLWALTFGEPDTKKRKHRHQIGRAKPQGAGVLNADVQLSRIAPLGCGNRNLAQPNDTATYIGLFRDYMTDKLSHPLEASPAVKALLKTANPAVGRAATQAPTLDMLPLEAPGGRPTHSYPKQKEDFDKKRVAAPRTDKNLLPDLPDE